VHDHEFAIVQNYTLALHETEAVRSVFIRFNPHSQDLEAREFFRKNRFVVSLAIIGEAIPCLYLKPSG
jgi:hypothetical protein